MVEKKAPPVFPSLSIEMLHQSPQVIWFCEQLNLKKQHNVISWTKRDNHLTWEFVVSVTEQWKIVHKRWVWNGLYHIKAANCYSENSFFKNRSHQEQLASSSYQRTQPLVKCFINNCLLSEFSAQILSKINIFPFSHEAMYS